MKTLLRLLNGESKEATERLNKAADDLTRTVSMSRAEFKDLVDREKQREISAVIQFAPFAEICEFRSAKEGSAMVVCRNPKHEAAKSGIAPCRQAVCPKLPK